MAFFDVPVVIPFWMLLVGVVAIMAPIGWIIREYQMNKKYCPERGVIITARRNGVPIIELIDIGSGNAVWELGVKKNVNDIKFDSQYSGIRVDPVLTTVGCEPKRFGGGLDVYSYAYENWLPQTHRNHLAARAIVTYFHTKAKDLEFLTDIEFVALVSTPETHLAHDIMIYISKYFKSTESTIGGKKVRKMLRREQIIDPDQYIMGVNENGESVPLIDEKGEKVLNPTYNQLIWVETEVNPADLINRIEEIKKDIYMMPICFGWYAGTEAFKNNSYAYAAQDLEMLLIIHDKLQLADVLKKINMMTYAIAALIIMMGAALGYYIVSMVKK